MQKLKQIAAGFLVLALVFGLFGFPVNKRAEAATITVSGTVLWIDGYVYVTGTLANPPADRPTQTNWRNNSLALFRDGVLYTGAGSTPTVTTVNASTWSFTWSNLDSDYTWTVDQSTVTRYSGSISGNSATGYSIVNIAERNLEMNYEMRPDGNDTFFIFGTASNEPYQAAMHVIYYGPGITSQIVFCLEHRNAPPYPNIPRNYAPIDPYVFYGSAPYNLDEETITELITGIIVILQNGYPNMDENNVPVPAVNYAGATGPARYATAAALRWWVRSIVGRSPGTYYTPGNLYDDLDDIVPNTRLLRPRDVNLVTPRTAEQNEYLFEWAFGLYEKAGRQELLQHKVTLTPGNMHLVEDIGGEYYEGTVNVALTNCNRGYYVSDASVAAIRALGGTISPLAGSGNGTITITVPAAAAVGLRSIEIEVFGRDTRASQNFNIYKPATATNVQTVGHFIVTPREVADAEVELEFPVSLTVNKSWSPSVPSGASVTFQLTKGGVDVPGETVTLTGPWTHTWTDLPYATDYSVRETAFAPSTYNSVIGSVTESPAGSGNFVLNVTNTEKTCSLTVNKSWSPSVPSGASVTFQLTKGGVDVPGETVTLTGPWTHTWTDLPYATDYSVRETAFAPSTYNSVIGSVTEIPAGSGNFVLNVTNTEKTCSLTVNKSWSPSVPSGATVTFQLTKGGVDVPGETVTLTGPWSHTWTDLPYATDYSVRETAFAPSTYNSVIGSVTESPTDSGNFVLNVTNTEKTCSLTVNKSWSPSVPSGATVTFQLTKGGVDVPGETVTLTGPWSHTWTDLPYATDYSVRETAFAPSTYNSVIGSVTESPAGSGNFVLNVTNTEKTCSLTVNKAWSPTVPTGASVTFQLTKGGVDVPGATVTLTGPWSHTWTNLPYATDYSVRETTFAPSTYNSVIGSVTETPAGSGNFVLNVTNTEKVCSLTVNKSWSPSVPTGASVTFQLTKGGVDVPGQTVTLTGPWTHTWTDLPYATDYSVRETAFAPSTYNSVTGSVTESPAGSGNFVLDVTNTEKTCSLTVNKSWSPTVPTGASVTFQLTKGGVDVPGQTVTLTGPWSHTWTDLPYGTDYSVRETAFAPSTYNSVIGSVTETPAGSGNFVLNVTNTEKVCSLTVNKSWSPTVPTGASVTFQLTKGGVDVPGQTVTLTGPWSHTWTNLPYATDYSVRETAFAPSTYNSVIGSVTETPAGSGNFVLDVTNTEKTCSLTVNKSWSPTVPTGATVTFQLTKGGVDVPGQTVTLTGPWSHTWTNLPYATDYSVRETAFAPSTYNSVIGSVTESPAGSGNFVLNVTNTEKLISVTITKEWTGGVPTGGCATFQLKKNGDNLGAPVTLNGTESIPWTHTWTDLPISGVYTVVETDCMPTTYTQDGSIAANAPDEGGNLRFTATNSYILIDISVTKEWITPESITLPESVRVQLQKNGEPEGAPVTLNDENDWTHTWEDLDPAETWTVVEVAVPVGYKVEYGGNAEDGFTVTNTNMHRMQTGEGALLWNLLFLLGAAVCGLAVLGIGRKRRPE